MPLNSKSNNTTTVSSTSNPKSYSSRIAKMTFLLGLTTSHLSRRHAVRAFSNSVLTHHQQNQRLAHAVGQSYSMSLGFTSNRMYKIGQEQVLRKSWNRSSTSRAASSVEEDLDSALDEILGDLDMEETESPSAIMNVESDMAPVEEKEESEEDAAPAPVKVDYSDASFLSITNPYWTQNGLSPKVIQALSEKGISQFTPVQAEAFLPALAGKDVIGRSRTGTGKTLAFGIPAAHRLFQLGTLDRNNRRARGRKPSMIVLCPTRELARQVQDEIRQIGNPLSLYVDCFHGGVSYDPQARALRDGIDILVGTPGRIMDHIHRGNLSLSECRTVVLDEADEMLNMGFAEDVEDILEGVGCDNEEKTQCLLFSATTPPWVKEIGRKYQDDDVVMIDSTGKDTGARTAKTVRHVAIQVPPGPDSRKAILEDIIAVEISKDMKTEESLKEESDNLEETNAIAAAALAKKKKSSGAMQQKIFGKTIVFTETKRDADELVSGGVFKSLTAQALHGDVGQKQRDATLNAFRAGSFNVLVATDVAARGIDINDVDVVVQFGPPRDTGTLFWFSPFFPCTYL